MALVDALHGLLHLPGATYSCVVERDTGRVLAEAGDGGAGAGDGEGVVPYSVARWGTGVAAMFDATDGDELDDVMMAGKRSYHLVRPLGPDASVLIYLRLDRSRSNLAVARRELGKIRWGTGPVEAPAPRGAVDLRSVPGGRAEGPAARSADRAPAGRTPAGRTPAGRGSADRGSADRASADRASADRSGVDRPGADRPSVDRSPLDRVSAAQGAAAVRPAARTPASLPPSATPARAWPSVVAATGDLEPPSAPVIPLPRRASAPLPAEAPRTLVGVAGDAAPEGFAMPAVLGQSWARDPGTLRRLIAGLRRMS